jgi:hypothetical protein
MMVLAGVERGAKGEVGSKPITARATAEDVNGRGPGAMPNPPAAGERPEQRAAQSAAGRQPARRRVCGFKVDSTHVKDHVRSFLSILRPSGLLALTRVSAPPAECPPEIRDAAALEDTSLRVDDAS